MPENTKPTPAQAAIVIGYLRIWQITGDTKKGIEPLLPIGRSTFLERVRKGIYPKPVKLGPHTSAWKKADIMALLASFEGV